jgi:hypothetical protein
MPALTSLTLAKESLNRQFATMIDSVSSVGLPSIFSAQQDESKTTHKRKHSETDEIVQMSPRKSPRHAQARLVKQPVSQKHHHDKGTGVSVTRTQVLSSPPSTSVEMNRKTSSSPITTQLMAGVSAVIEKVVKKMKINRNEQDKVSVTESVSSLEVSSLLKLPANGSSLNSTASASPAMVSPQDTPATSPSRKLHGKNKQKYAQTASIEHAELNSPLDMSQRIDFFVQESLIDNNVHQFLLGLKSHFSYWWNKDIHHFIVKNLVQKRSPEEEVDIAVKANAKPDSSS